MRCAQRTAPASSGLPCQNRNNSNNKPKRYRLEPVPGSEVFFKSKDNDRAVWKKIDGKTSMRKLIKEIVSDYDVSEEKVLRDVQKFVGRLQKLELVRESLPDRNQK